MIFKKIIILVIVILFTIYSNAQEINSKYPEKERIELNIENVCKGDTSKTIYLFVNIKKNNVLKNFEIVNPDLRIYFNDSVVHNNEIHINKRKGNHLLIQYISSFNTNNIGSVNFDIFKKDTFVKSVKIIIYNYAHIITRNELDSDDTICINKSDNCLKNSLIYFPNAGTSTYIRIFNSESTVFEYNFTYLEKILIDFSKFQDDIYNLEYISDFYKRSKILEITTNLSKN